MDSYVEELHGNYLCLDDFRKLVDFSRVDKLQRYENFRTICRWFHDCEDFTQDGELSTTIANVLLQTADIRAKAVEDQETSLIADIQNRLYKSPKDLAKWRILFLLVHSKPAEKPDFPLCAEMFDRFLAPTLFRKMVQELSIDDVSVIPVFVELGKFWYALCYNYGYSVDRSQVYWEVFDELNRKLSRNLEPFEDCLIQLGSIYILLHSQRMLVHKATVCNFLKIFERKFEKWSNQASRELYCPLDEHRLPQVLNILELLIIYSDDKLRDEIRNCFLDANNSMGFLHVRSSFTELIESPINNISNITSSILKLLHLKHDKKSHALFEHNPSSEYVIFSDNVRNLPTPISSNSWYNHSSKKIDNDFDTWSEEEQLRDAEKVFNAIERLNDLGIIKMSSN